VKNVNTFTVNNVIQHFPLALPLSIIYETHRHVNLIYAFFPV